MQSLLTQQYWTGLVDWASRASLKVLQYLYIRHPEQSYIEDTVGDEAHEVESQEVKVKTYNTENKHVHVMCSFIGLASYYRTVSEN